MAEHAALYIAGNYAEPAADQAVRPVLSPVTGEHLADLPVATAEQIDQAVAAAPVAFEDYRHWSAHERGRHLRPGLNAPHEVPIRATWE